MTRHNKLTLGLLLPELAAVPEFSVPVDHTVLLPDYRLAELQNCVAEMFPAMKPSPSVDIGKEESVAGGMSSKPECLFGLSCFRRNPDHYQRYHITTWLPWLPPRSRTGGRPPWSSSAPR